MHNLSLFTGNAEPHRATIPPAPPWRRFNNRDVKEGPYLRALPSDMDHAAPFQASPSMVEAVNAALALRRPLLLTGRPGSGKSSLIEAVARELELGRILRWHVTSASSLKEALYSYDAIGRLHDHGLRQQRDSQTPTNAPNIEAYLRLGPLGTALLPSARPRALLIDEIDKSGLDLPHDLLNVFERGEFEIPELARIGAGPIRVRVDGGNETYDVKHGHVACTEFPFVVLTSNGEQDFPPAFLRRCIRLRMPDPDVTQLTKIVTAHLGSETAKASEELIRDFAAVAQNDPAYATDQLINAIFLVTGDGAPTGSQRERMVELLLKKLISDVP